MEEEKPFESLLYWAPMVWEPESWRLQVERMSGWVRKLVEMEKTWWEEEYTWWNFDFSGFLGLRLVFGWVVEKDSGLENGFFFRVLFCWKSRSAAAEAPFMVSEKPGNFNSRKNVHLSSYIWYQSSCPLHRNLDKITSFQSKYLYIWHNYLTRCLSWFSSLKKVEH